jgi:hypothetical protein
MKSIKYGFTILLTLLVPLLVGSCCQSEITADKLTKLVAEKIPPDASMSQTVSFLDSNNIEHSDYIDIEKNPAYKEESSFQDHKLDYKRDKIKGFVVGKVCDANWHLFKKSFIQIHFYFDANGKLVAYTLRTISTSF